MKTKNLLFILLTVLITNYSFSQPLTIDYLGQTPPGDKPEVFAPNLISKVGRNERVLAFARDKKEVYFTVIISQNNYTIKSLTEKEGVWQDEQTASFITKYMNEYSCLEPFISPDGTKMLFTAKQKSDNSWNYNFYVTKREGKDWGKPEILSTNINPGTGVWHPCITSNRNVYFAIDGDIYFSAYTNNSYANPSPINSVNSSSKDWDPYVDPNEKYMIFKSNRPGGFGKMDNYISYRNSNGEWTEPKNIGAKYNTDLIDDAGDISPDGKFMFFSRISQDGDMDIYWVKANFIEELNPFSKSEIVKK
jgi:hypothetical protein